MLLVTYKCLAGLLDTRTPPIDFQRHEGHVAIGHYRSMRGMNTWQEYDGYITLGDPWMDKIAAEERAHALGIDD